MKRVLVTGAAGFLGAHVIRQVLAMGCTPIPAGRDSTSKWRLRGLEDLGWLSLDLNSARSVEEAVKGSQADIIIHCAAYGVDFQQQDSLPAISCNVAGTAAIVTAAAKADITRFIHVGSCFEYGDKLGMISEEEVLAPQTLYGATKAAGTLLALERARSFGLQLCVVRPFGLFGPLEASHRLVPLIREACYRRHPLALTSGEQIRDYTYIEDVASAIASLVWREEFPSGEIFNLGSGQGLSIRDFALACARFFGGEELMQIGTLPHRQSEMWHLVAHTSKWAQFAGSPVAKTRLDEALEHVEKSPHSGETAA